MNSVNLEASSPLSKDINLIKEFRNKAGFSFCFTSLIHLMNNTLREFYFIILMIVNPSWKGQKFIPSCRSKLSQLKNWKRGQKFEILGGIDGGIKLEDMEEVSGMG
jgi:ribulose-phosphate 3-epimerase